MRKQTILVIEDQKDFAQLVGRTLEQDGYDVILAADGTTGLRIARENQPDLVVLDLTMPDIDGLEVCKALRSEPRHAPFRFSFSPPALAPPTEFWDWNLGPTTI